MQTIKNTTQQSFTSLDEMLENITEGAAISAVCPGQIKINTKEDWFLVAVVTVVSALAIGLYEMKVNQNLNLGLAIGLVLVAFIVKFFVEYGGGRIDDAVVTTEHHIWLVYGVLHNTETKTFTYQQAFQLTPDEIQKKMSQRPYRMLRFRLPDGSNIRFARSGIKTKFETKVVHFRDAGKLLYNK